MNICIKNTVVKFDPSEEKKKKKNFQGKLYIGGGVLTLGAALLISLLNIYLKT